MLSWFESLPFAAFMAVLIVANLGMVLFSWLGVRLLQGALPHLRLNQAPVRLTRLEVGLSLGVVTLNIAAGVPGWWLWQRGFITLHTGGIGSAALDLALMVLYFDLSMYLLHRLAHLAPFYEHVHARHHRHVDVTGLSLYVMHPAEALGFASMLILFLLINPTHIGALLAFLALNWSYGTIGHSGLNLDYAALRWVCGDSTFHHTHHRRHEGNYGFFSPLWDKLLGTWRSS